MVSAFSVVFLACVLTAVRSTPTHERRQSIAAISTTQIDSYTPYTNYASTGYCAASTTINWSCGANCEANPNFIPTASGGNGDGTQYWFVGYDPTLNEVIVSHQGTDVTEILSDLTDADFFLESLSTTLFPGLSSSIEAHNGFQSEQAQTAQPVLAAVTSTMSQYGTTKVTVVGHSLGAAIALLDSVYLPLHLPSGSTVSFIGYGLPRVGNQAFASYVDDHPAVSVTHINNMEDLVPILPGMFLGFVHPAGEIHIQDSGSWDACPGEDNPSTLCIVGDVPNIFEGDESNHDGPYNGITMGC